MIGVFWVNGFKILDFQNIWKKRSDWRKSALTESRPIAGKLIAGRLKKLKMEFKIAKCQMSNVNCRMSNL